MWQILVFSLERRRPIGVVGCGLIAERERVLARAVHEDHEVVGVPDELRCRVPGAAPVGSLPVGSERFPLLGEVLVQAGEGDVRQQW